MAKPSPRTLALAGWLAGAAVARAWLARRAARDRGRAPAPRRGDPDAGEDVARGRGPLHAAGAGARPRAPAPAAAGAGARAPGGVRRPRGLGALVAVRRPLDVRPIAIESIYRDGRGRQGGGLRPRVPPRPRLGRALEAAVDGAVARCDAAADLGLPRPRAPRCARRPPPRLGGAGARTDRARRRGRRAARSVRQFSQPSRSQQ
jgi:hypothetical protein